MYVCVHAHQRNAHDFYSYVYARMHTKTYTRTLHVLTCMYMHANTGTERHTNVLHVWSFVQKDGTCRQYAVYTYTYISYMHAYPWNRMTHEDFARMARGDADSTRPKTRQRLQMAMDKSRTIAALESQNSSNMFGSRLTNTFSNGDEVSLAAIRNRMLQQRLSMGPRSVLP